jgi:hypothetical protein
VKRDLESKTLLIILKKMALNLIKMTFEALQVKSMELLLILTTAKRFVFWEEEHLALFINFCISLVELL